MSNIYNVYCDESCHLENDRQKAMVLGAIWCPVEKVREISVRLREIKVKHGMSKDFECKWTKVSPAKFELYKALVDYFFDDDDLHFRALIVPDKDLLNHTLFNQDHDTWYYKMYFDMLKVLLNPSDRYRIYIDIKDTQGAEKERKLHDVLCNNIYDFDREIVERLQSVQSHEVEILQLADLLIGAVSYVNRGLVRSEAKLSLVNRIVDRSGYQLTKSTLLREGKFNLLVWRASDGGKNGE